MSVVIGSHNEHGNWSGVSGMVDPVARFVEEIERKGHATVEPIAFAKPWNHRVAGVGVGHNDAEFAETGRSMAAYYENGESITGRRWWDADEWSSVRKHYHTEVK